MSDSPSYPKRIDVRSLVSGRNREPYVTIEWGKQKAQLTPAEARRHAQIITEAADAAISDAFLISWLSERVGVHDGVLAAALTEFRSYRIAQEERDPVVAEADREADRRE